MNVRRNRESSGGAAGFTLAELLVTMLVISVVLLAALAMFDFNSRVSRVQTQVADMQQSLRVAQLDLVRVARMAGRGGLPVRSVPGRNLPRGVAVEVVNNVADGTQIGFTAGAGPAVLAGTDILAIRGVFSTPMYQVNFANAATFVLGTPANGGTILISSTSPTGVPQDLTPIIDAVNDGTPEALLLVSPLADNIYAVVELVPGAPTDVSDPNLITLAFQASGGTHTTDYIGLSPGGAYPGTLNSIAMVGILEEHRFYVREEFAVPGDSTSELTPRLTRARVFPGTDTPYRGAAGNWQIDIADNILDLQVALGLDTNNDGLLTDDGTANDEWLFNHPADDATQSRWVTVTDPTNPRPTPLYYLRLTTLGRTDRRDRDYQSPLLTALEDHSYATPPSNQLNARTERMYRRRALETVIDVRNL